MNGPINQGVSSALARVFSRRSAILKIVEEKALGTRLGSFFQRPREAEKRDPGNEVGHGCKLGRHFKQSHRLMMWCFFFRARRFCPTGSYLNNLDLFDKLQCCRPLHHPKSYGSCYYEDVLFNSRRRCQLAGYYITGFYRYSHYLPLSVSKLRCCKMAKTGNSILFDSHMDQESVVR